MFSIPIKRLVTSAHIVVNGRLLCGDFILSIKYMRQRITVLHNFHTTLTYCTHTHTQRQTHLPMMVKVNGISIFVKFYAYRQQRYFGLVEHIFCCCNLLSLWFNIFVFGIFLSFRLLSHFIGFKWQIG